MVWLTLHRAFAFQLLQVGLAQDDFVELQDLREDLSFDGACLISVDLDEQLLDLLLGFVALLLV